MPGQNEIFDSPTADAEEVRKFDDAAQDWWDPDGSMAPLHKMQPVRLDYVLDQIAAEFGVDRRARKPLAGLRILDVGCGAGLMSLPMARLGAQTLGIDASKPALQAARAQAEACDVEVSFDEKMVEDIAAEGAQFDVVLVMEVVEHTPNPAALIASAAAALRPGGLLIASTLNRTLKAFTFGVLGAEYALGWLPRGTHDWRKFVTPLELADAMKTAGAPMVDQAGFVYAPMQDAWRRDSDDLSINYAMTGLRPE